MNVGRTSGTNRCGPGVSVLDETRDIGVDHDPVVDDWWPGGGLGAIGRDPGRDYLVARCLLIRGLPDVEGGAAVRGLEPGIENEPRHSREPRREVVGVLGDDRLDIGARGIASV